MARTEQRQVVRAGLRQETLALIGCAVLVTLAAITFLAGQLAGFVTGHGWMSWHGAGFGVIKPLAEVYLHAGDPMRGWPNQLRSGARPGPVAYWITFGLLWGAVAVPGFWIARRVNGGRGRPGFASAHEVQRRLGTKALIKQAPRLRPTLTSSTSTRPRPEQIGTSLGRDVHTGVDCWSSVRQSKYVVGPSESGKTSAVVIPEALDFDGRLICASTRADVMAATWKARADRDDRVLLFDPLRMAPALPLLHWPGLVSACIDPATAMRRAQDLTANVDMSGVSNGDTWKNRGQAIMRNLLHAAALTHGDIRTVLKWAYDQTNTEPATILDRSPNTPSSWAEQQFSTIQTPDKQRAGYYMAVESALEPFTHPAVLEAVLPGAHNFNATDLFDPSMGGHTIYLLSQVDQAVAVTGLLAALMSEVVDRARAAGQRSRKNRLDPPLKILLDEAPNTGDAFGQLHSLIADGGGRGIPTTMVVQDRNQAIKSWGRDDAASMWGAATIRQVLPGVADEDGMREIASYFREYDEEIPTWSRGQGGYSEQYSLRPRAGMTGAEVRSIEPFHSLVIAAGGLQPVETELTPYFLRPDYAQVGPAEEKFYDALNSGGCLL
jgi:type IV secretion system protein VirD4